MDTSDPRHPFNVSVRRRRFILLAGLIASFNCTLGSSLPSGATVSLSKHFGLPVSSSSLVLLNSLYMTGCAVSPLIFAPLSEVIGRRPVLIGSFTGYTLFTLCCALSPTYSALLAFRTFASLSAGVPSAVVGGLIGDVCDGPKIRGNAMAWFMLIGLGGPLVGPLVSGYVSVNLGWRWTFWVGLMLAGLGLPFIWLLPETYTPVLAQTIADGGEELQLMKAGVRDHLKSTCSMLKRPWLMMVKEPILLLTSLYLALVYAIVYLFFQAYPIVYGGIYGLKQDRIGLAYIPLMAGGIGGFAFFHLFNILHTRAANNNRAWAYVEEYRRLPLACFGGPCIPVALLVLSFGARSNIHPAIPMIISGILFGLGYLLVFSGMIVYLSDTYKRYSASAQAAASTTRALAAVALPFAAQPLYRDIGIKWAGVLLSVISGLMVAIPVVFLLFNSKIRATSKFAG
ncbi:major facilitator superfamily domain-containing protein [Paraphoma chrysanthemicola]|nr:major facilitator superfamily domain-containing protein [Paraphoma chrysanthemicola]